MKDEQENISNDLEKDPQYIQKLWIAYSRQHAASSSRQARLEDLLSRNSAKKLGEKKLAQMAKRLEVARQEKEQTLVFIEQIKSQAEKLGIPLGG